MSHFVIVNNDITINGKPIRKGQVFFHREDLRLSNGTYVIYDDSFPDGLYLDQFKATEIDLPPIFGCGNNPVWEAITYSNLSHKALFSIKIRFNLYKDALKDYCDNPHDPYLMANCQLHRDLIVADQIYLNKKVSGRTE